MYRERERYLKSREVKRYKECALAFTEKKLVNSEPLRPAAHHITLYIFKSWSLDLELPYPQGGLCKCVFFLKTFQKCFTMSHVSTLDVEAFLEV